MPWCHTALPFLAPLALALLAPPTARPAGPPRPRTDSHGDRLPPGAIARLGTVRLRPGDPYVVFAVSPDGKALATGEGHGKVRLWDLATGKQLRCVHLKTATRVTRIGFSPDGKSFAAISGGGGHQPCGDFYPTGESCLHLSSVVGGKVLTLFKHTSPEGLHPDRMGGVRGLDFMAGGKALVSRVTEDEQPATASRVLVWDVTTGKVLRRIAGGRVHACSPDGKTLAVAGGRSVRLVDIATGKELRRLEGHRRPVHALAFAPDGKLLASGCGDDESLKDKRTGEKKIDPDPAVRLWDVATGRQRACLKGHRQTVSFLTFSPDGRSLASADTPGWNTWADGSLLLWDVFAGKLRKRFTINAGLARALAFSADGKTLAWCPRDLTVRLWDVAAGKEKRRLPEYHASCNVVAFSPDGRLLLASGDRFRVWDAVTGEEVHLYDSHRAAVAELLFSPDGRTLVSRDCQYALRLWEVKGGKPLPPFLGPTPHPADCFAFTPDGKGLIAVGHDGKARRWAVRSGRLVREFRVTEPFHLAYLELDRYTSREPFGSFGRMPGWHAIDPSCKTLASSWQGGRTDLWDLATGKRFLRLPSEFWGFSPDGKTLLSKDDDGRTGRLWALPGGKLIHRQTTQATWGKLAAFPAGHFAAFSADGKLLAWGEGRKIDLWEPARGKKVGRLTAPLEKVVAAVFDRDGTTLVSGGADGTVRLWDVASKRELHSYPCEEAGTGPLYPMRFPGGRLLAVIPAGDHQEPRFVVREALTGRVLHPDLESEQPCAVSPDGKTLAVANVKGSAGGRTVVFREIATGREVGHLPAGHGGEITALAFSPDGAVLATGGMDTSILVWDWKRFCGLAGTPGVPRDDKRLAALWDDLASANARKGYAAVGTLAACPGQAVALLKGRVRAVSEAECRPVRRWLADLDSDDFAARTRATAGLRKLHAEWLPFFYDALRGKPSPEVSARVRRLLAEPRKTNWSTDTLQRVRAVQVLEQVGTPEARAVLRQLAGGVRGAVLTQEAKAALRRLEGRPGAAGESPEGRR